MKRFWKILRRLKVIKVTELAIYPVKSCGQISLKEANADAFGLHMDRRWMLVNETGAFLSQRKFPRMSLIKPTLMVDGVVLDVAKHPDGQNKCEINVKKLIHQRQVIVWGDSCNGLDCGDEAAVWLSQFLEINCRLVYFPENEVRQVDLEYANQGEKTAFSDGFPFLLISEPSLTDLNARLLKSGQKSVEMRRFRPNIVVSGCRPFEEDNWKKIQIGDTALRVVKPCSRCTIPNVDPETGILGNEPSQTLKEYRLWDHPQIGKKIFFGQNVIAESIGHFEIGMPVTIIE